MSDLSKPVDLALLMTAGARLARRLAAKSDLSYHADELCDLAVSGLARALHGYDPTQGELVPYALVWMEGEILHEIEREQKRADRFSTADQVPPSPHPAVRVEELASTLTDPLLAVNVGEDLRTHGDGVVLKREASALLYREVGRLPEEDQRLLELHYWDELTWEEVGQALAINEKTARDRFARIRTRLHDAIVAWDRVRPLGKKST